MLTLVPINIFLIYVRVIKLVDFLNLSHLKVLNIKKILQIIKNIVNYSHVKKILIRTTSIIENYVNISSNGTISAWKKKNLLKFKMVNKKYYWFGFC